MVVSKDVIDRGGVRKKPEKDKASINMRGVNRILVATGASMTPPVKERFLRCLEICSTWYNDAIRYNHSDPQKEQQKYIGQLRTALREIVALLNEETLPANLKSFLPELAPYSSLLTQIEQLDPKLKRIESLRSDAMPLTGLESDFVDALQYQDHFKERSPFDWLAGVYLPEVFYLFFRVHPGWGKGKQFLSFAESCLREMKVKMGASGTYSRRTISRAVRLNRRRRKAGPLVDRDVPDQLEWYRHMSLVRAIGLRSKTPIEYARAFLIEANADKREPLRRA